MLFLAGRSSLITMVARRSTMTLDLGRTCFVAASSHCPLFSTAAKTASISHPTIVHDDLNRHLETQKYNYDIWQGYTVPKYTKVLEDTRRNLQRGLWETYMNTGQGANELFQSMTTGGGHHITLEDVQYFLSSIAGVVANAEGSNSAVVLREDAFEVLRNISQSGFHRGINIRNETQYHALDEREFYHWLSMAFIMKESDGNDPRHPPQTMKAYIEEVSEKLNNRRKKLQSILNKT